MVTLKKYQAIAERFGHFASWAVWEKAGYRPKSNIADMGVFDSRENPALLDMLNPEIVMVALNFSRKVCFEKPFMNFHDANPYGQDYKIRFAFEGTDYYGAYMTDIIKKFPMLSSKHVLIHLKNNPEQVDIQLNEFRKEMEFIGAGLPTILTFGKDTYNLLKSGLKENEYSSLVQLTHYSHHISKEEYRKDTHERLGITNS